MPTKDCKGFSLIEVLVTLLLVSIGALGMVALQIRTVQYTQDATIRNNAAILANDLLEIIRTHPQELSEFFNESGEEFPQAPSSCSPLPEKSKEQLGCWAEKAAKTLPGAANLLKEKFHICQIADANANPPCSATGKALQIQLAWQVYKGECVVPQELTVDGEKINFCTYSLRARI